jgi:hypothetical protein
MCDAMQAHVDYHVAAMEYAYGIMKHLAANNDIQIKLASLGGCEVLITAIRVHVDNALVMERACAAMK